MVRSFSRSTSLRLAFVAVATLSVAACQKKQPTYPTQQPTPRADNNAPPPRTELPPAVGYMAVYRTVNGCEVPMTIVEYRTGRRL